MRTARFRIPDGPAVRAVPAPESPNRRSVFPLLDAEAFAVNGPPRGFRIPVISSRALTPTSHAIQIEKPAGFTFLPTQFTILRLNTDLGPDARRMSLASSPTRPYLEYAVRVSDSPYKKAFAALRPGDGVALFGPIGDFVLRETRPAVFLAGGIGITSLKGMAEYAADKALPIPIRLLYSSRNEEEIAYRAELDALEKQNPNFRVVYTLTRSTDDGWKGLTGRIDQRLLKEATDGLVDPVYYVVGTPGMVAGTWRLLHDLGVPEDDIEFEAFHGYE